MNYIPNKIYIVFDGTSHYGVYGCDVEEEINDNDVEVVKGPYNDWDNSVDDEIAKLNDEAYGTHMYR
jgi:hypothetical protein